jgi:hypothetical protein
VRLTQSIRKRRDEIQAYSLLLMIRLLRRFIRGITAARGFELIRKDANGQRKVNCFSQIK